MLGRKRRQRHGGKPAAYRVQVRARKAGPWRDVGSTVEPAITLYNQESGTELNYRVLAVNRAGEGSPSAAVTAVL
ncbi:MAG: fibronectin type III domain-containing protein [Gemmatimonadota bacterium]|nr:fibronectin type III domain-containing protein [Gemmatimonadota bacterium]